MDEKTLFNIFTGEVIQPSLTSEQAQTLSLVDDLIASNTLMLEKIQPTLHPGKPIPASGSWQKYAQVMGLLNAARLKEKKLTSNVALLAAIKNSLINKTMEPDVAKQLMKSLKY